MNQAETFKYHSKTFSFAALFFPKKVFKDVVKLYFYLRSLDDHYEGKNLLDSDQLAQMNEIECEFIQKMEMPSEIFDEFKKGMELDQKEINFNDIDQLLHYCYAAASTVGLMLCHIFGVKEKKALYHAIDLGIAMQLTNICRDIHEDYLHKKIFLPPISDSMLTRASKKSIYKIQKRYLKIADNYYESAYAGLEYLPFRVRLSVYTAAILYQKIGAQILKDQNYLNRSYINNMKKILILLFVVPFGLFKISIRPSQRHKKHLHEGLNGLPYVNYHS